MTTSQVNRFTNKLTETDKEIITIRRRIDELLEDDRLWHNLTWTKVKIIQRITIKFLKSIEGTKYDNDRDQFGDSMAHVLRVNSQRHRKDDSPATYLTWVSFGYHHFMRRYQPDYVEDWRKSNRFYKKTLVRLVS